MKILIVGAGPAGLTTAVELARRGIQARLIDKKTAPSPLSRAVGIHAHTLELLEECGATERLLAEGLKIRYVAIHQGRDVAATIDFGRIGHRYNFILALPQDRTEAILIERLQSYGGAVEFGTEMTRLSTQGKEATVTVVRDGEASSACYDLVIGADGYRSHVRETAGIIMKGTSHQEQWSIADFESSDIPYADGKAHLFPSSDGRAVFLVPLGGTRYRLVANRPDALAELPGSFTVGLMHATARFYIAIKQAELFQRGVIFLAGDAAHVHSPAAGRGMNDGIEDACALARRIADGTADGYQAERYASDLANLYLTERALKLATASDPLIRILRLFMLRFALHVPAVQRAVARRIAGLSGPA